MSRIASRQPRRPRPSQDAGFTLTELIAGLLVASLLMAGLVDIIRRYARTTADVRETASELRANTMTIAFLDEIERLDPGTLTVEAHEVRGQLGGEQLSGQIITSKEASTLRWSSPIASRAITLPAGAHFVRLASGAVAIVQEDDGPPLAIAIPRRTLPFDCQFDTVSNECRK